MLALSVKQPWAWLIVSGFKDVENRSWPTHVRGDILIHAGKVPDAKFDYARWEKHIGRPIPRDLFLGGIVGKARIKECVDFYESRWFFGEYGFVVDCPRMFQNPIPYRGQLGFFNVPDFNLEGVF